MEGSFTRSCGSHKVASSTYEGNLLPSLKSSASEWEQRSVSVAATTLIELQFQKAEEHPRAKKSWNQRCYAVSGTFSSFSLPILHPRPRCHPLSSWCIATSATSVHSVSLVRLQTLQQQVCFLLAKARCVRRF